MTTPATSSTRPGHAGRAGHLAQPDPADQRRAGHLEQDDDRHRGRRHLAQREVEQRVPEQLRPEGQRDEHHPGGGRVAGQRHPADQADGEQDQARTPSSRPPCTRWCSSSCAPARPARCRRRRAAPPASASRSPSDGGTGRAQVGARWRRPRRTPPPRCRPTSATGSRRPCADRDEALPDRLGRDQRGRGGDRGELGARHPGGEVPASATPGQHAEQAFPPAGASSERDQFAPAPRARHGDEHARPPWRCARTRWPAPGAAAYAISGPDEETATTAVPSAAYGRS